MDYNGVDRMKDLDRINRQYLKDYILFLESKRLKQSSIKTKFWRIYAFLAFVKFRDARKVTRSDLERYFALRKSMKSNSTVYGDWVEIHQFFKWISPDKVDSLFQNVPLNSLERLSYHVSKELSLTSKDIWMLIDASDKPRDRALLAMMWEIGATSQELVDLNVKDIQFYPRYAKVTLFRDNKPCTIRMVDFYPELLEWMKINPSKHNHNNPLFVADRKTDGQYNRLGVRSVENVIKKMSRNTGIRKIVNPRSILQSRCS